MFARVITAQAGAEGFDNIIGLAEQQLPSARQRPGFQGFYLLADEETGKWTRPTAVAMTRPPLTCLRPQGPYDSPGDPPVEGAVRDITIMGVRSEKGAGSPARAIQETPYSSTGV